MLYLILKLQVPLSHFLLECRPNARFGALQFVKESLRLDPPSPYAHRVCQKAEDVSDHPFFYTAFNLLVSYCYLFWGGVQFIPLAEPVMGRDGTMINEVRITKGTMVMLRAL